jgi:hypothetical protein
MNKLIRIGLVVLFAVLIALQSRSPWILFQPYGLMAVILLALAQMGNGTPFRRASFRAGIAVCLFEMVIAAQNALTDPQLGAFGAMAALVAFGYGLIGRILTGDKYE